MAGHIAVLAFLLSSLLAAGEPETVEDASRPEDRPASRVPPRLTWKHMSRALTGLPSDRITALLVGRGADLWAGTSDAGLLLIRGTGVTHIPPSEEGLPASPITALALDADGALWAGTAGSGLARYHKESWYRADVRNGLPSNRITALAWTDARLMVGTDAGLCEWSAEQRPSRVWGPREGLASPHVTALAPFAEEELIAGTLDGIYRLQGREDLERLPLPGPSWIASALALPKLAVFERPAIVLGTPAGATLLDPTEPEPPLSRLGVERGLPDGRVIALASTGARARGIWLGTDGGGLAHLEPRRDRTERPFIEVTTIAPGPATYPHGRISALAADGEKLWVASTDGGLSIATLSDAPSATTQTASSGSAPASTAAASTATCTPDRRLSFWIERMSPKWNVTAWAATSTEVWAGFAQAGAARGSPPDCEWVFFPRVTDGIAGKKREIPHYPSSVSSAFAGAGLGGDQVHDILADTDGTLWFATQDMGLSHRIGKEFLALGAPDGVPTRRVRRLHLDLATGDIFAIATNDQGVIYDDPDGGPDKINPRDLVLRRSGGQWRVLPMSPPELLRKLSFNCVLHTRRDGKLLLGSDRGLFEYDGRALKPVKLRAAILDLRTGRSVPMDSVSATRMASAAVHGLCQDTKGDVWIATEGGLLRDDGSMATRIPGTEAEMTWDVSHDADTKSIYYLGTQVMERLRGTISMMKGTLYRYRLADGRRFLVKTKVIRYLVTPGAVWCSVPPYVYARTPKPSP